MPNKKRKYGALRLHIAPLIPISQPITESSETTKYRHAVINLLQLYYCTRVQLINFDLRLQITLQPGQPDRPTTTAHSPSRLTHI